MPPSLSTPHHPHTPYYSFPRVVLCAPTPSVRSFYHYYYHHAPIFDETGILNGLTPQLRVEVTSFLLQEMVGS